MVPICDLFVSIQGEGKYMGVPSIFIRVSGCNLRCVFKGSICDTPYSSFNPEKSKYSIDDVKKLVKDNPQIDHVVITGGEPLLYKNDVDYQDLVSWLYFEDKLITVETNGTISPIVEGKYNPAYVHLYSISPKLSTSVGEEGQILGNGMTLTKEMVERHEKTRINIDSLYDLIVKTKTRYQLKFVYSGKECVDEILDICKRLNDIEKEKHIPSNLTNLCGLNKSIYLMPEGITNESISSKGGEIVEECLKYGWNYTDRLHIRLFGDKRGF